MKIPTKSQEPKYVPQPTDSRFTEKYDMTLSDMAKAELRGHFKEAVLAWVDASGDPTRGVELVRMAVDRATFCPVRQVGAVKCK